MTNGDFVNVQFFYLCKHCYLNKSFYKAAMKHINYEYFETEDFVRDEQFISWVKHPNDLSNHFWKNWLEKYPEKAAVLKEARKLIEAIKFATVPVQSTLYEEMLSNIYQQIELNENPLRSPKRLFMKKLAGAVAVLLVGVLGIFLYQKLLPSKLALRTTYGETKTINLPDGSVVTLNANSFLKTSKNWTPAEERKVWLEGEAYFEVSSTPIVGSQKFIVHAGVVNIKVTGTQFNVRHRSTNTEVVLTEGKINCYIKNKPEHPVPLLPGEMVVYNPTDQSIDKSKVATEVHTAWKSNVLVFKNTPLAHLIDIFENYYGYAVVIEDPSLLLKKLDGKIGNTDIDVLIKGVATVFGISITKANNNTIVIKNQKLTSQS